MKTVLYIHQINLLGNTSVARDNFIEFPKQISKFKDLISLVEYHIITIPNLSLVSNIIR